MPQELKIGSLATTLFPAENPRGQLVVAGAMGVPQGFYRRAATYWASDFDVWTFDYRAIGRSRQGDLRGDPTNMRDWAEDFARVVDHVAERGRVVICGHSFGGQVFMMSEAHKKTLGLFTMASGAGWSGHMPFLERWRVNLMWHVIGPIIARAFGYLRWSSLGMGEDLPLEVYRDWKRWCAHPNYFFGDPEAEFTKNAHEIEVPVVALNSTDDLWASPDSARALFAECPTVEHRVLEPRRPLGHMGYYKMGAEDLWREAAEFFDARIASA